MYPDFQYISFHEQSDRVSFLEGKVFQYGWIFLPFSFWKRCFLKTSVSNGIIYTKYTQNSHTLEPPFNIATQSAT